MELGVASPKLAAQWPCSSSDDLRPIRRLILDRDLRFRVDAGDDGALHLSAPATRNGDRRKHARSEQGHAARRAIRRKR